MAGEALAALKSILMTQTLFQNIENTLHPYAYKCPPTPAIEDIASKFFDYIIVGGGTAGLVLANRLSACPNIDVLVLEAGYCPRTEANIASYFGLEPLTQYDYNTTGTNDEFSCQNLQGMVPALTQGKMLSGTSGISHMIVCRGAPPDYDKWAKITKDPSWAYKRLLKYFKRSEDVRDQPTLQVHSAIHGTSGPVIETKQQKPQDGFVIEAYKEIGLKYVVDTGTKDTSNGVTDPLFFIGSTYKQNTVESYIRRIVNRKNLFVMTGATVTRVLFEKKVATGVQFTYNNESYTAYANTEVIVSAGALRTPQLLIVSGIGPEDQLAELGVPPISVAPVGKNLQDHVSSSIVFALDRSTTATPAVDIHKFPIPLTVAYANLRDPNAGYSQCLGVNIYVPNNNGNTLMQLCLLVFKYSIPICQTMYEANINRTLLFVPVYLLYPKSRGEVRCNSTNVEDQPIFNMNYFTKEPDLEDLSACMGYTGSLLNSTKFEAVGAEMVDFGFCTEYELYSPEFWTCYTVAMSCNGWDFGGTAAMGSVVDTNGLVKGVLKLRVVDASVFPTLPGGKPEAAVLAVAEKISDNILSRNFKCSSY